MKFYQRTWFMVLTLIFFAPVGIFVMWKYHRFSKAGKVILSIVSGLIFIIGLASNSSNKGNTGKNNNVAVNPTNPPAVTENTEQPENTPTPVPEKKVNVIKSGMYKVGTDLDAGEYVLIGSGYMQLSKDSTGTLESIIANDNTQNRSYITVANGQYLTLQGLKGYKPEDAPKAEAQDNVLPAGMYKVGTDIQPGEYKGRASGGDSGYIEVARNSSHTLESIVSNDNFTGEKYITVSAGQYLKLSNAELQLK